MRVPTYERQVRARNEGINIPRPVNPFPEHNVQVVQGALKSPTNPMTGKRADLSQLQMTPPPAPASPDFTAENAALSLAGKLGQLAEQMRQKEVRDQAELDAARVDEAFANFRAQSREQLTSIHGLKDSAAIGSTEKYGTWHDERTKDTMEALENDEQKFKFKLRAMALKDRRLESLSNYESQQRQAYIKKVDEQAELDTMQELYANPWQLNLRPKLIGDKNDKRKPDVIDMAVQGYKSRHQGQTVGAELVKMEGRLRTAAVQSMIDQNPAMAIPYLEAWRIDLGGSYKTLKTRLNGALEEQVITNTKKLLDSKHGGNIPEKIKAVMGAQIPHGAKTKIASEYRTELMLQDRADRKHEKNKKELTTRGNIETTLAFDRGELTNDQLQAKFKNREIDSSTYNALRNRMTKETEWAQHDNPFVLGELETALTRGMDVRADTQKALVNGEITQKTFNSLIKATGDKEYKRARSRITNVLKPSQFEKIGGGEHARYDEALRNFDANIEAGMEPDEAANEALHGYKINHPINMVRVPEELTGDKTDIAALDAAKQKIVEKFQGGQLTMEQLELKLDSLKRFKEYALEQQRMKATEGELDEANRKRVK